MSALLRRFFVAGDLHFPYSHYMKLGSLDRRLRYRTCKILPNLMNSTANSSTQDSVGFLCGYRPTMRTHVYARLIRHLSPKTEAALP